MTPAWAWRTLRRQSDWLVVAAILAFAQVDLWLIGEGFRGGRAANLAFILAVSVPLLWRRRAPLAVFVAVVAITLAGSHALYGLTHQPPIEPWFATLIAIYSLTAHAAGRAAWITLAVAGSTAFAFDVAASAAGADSGETWPAWAFYVGAAAIGRSARRRRLLTSALEERTVQLEHEREEKARLAVLDERARVARELHDVIAHNVSVMVVQAAAERRSLAPEQTTTADVLDQIEQTGREALMELRRLLGVLRHGGAELPTLAPQPGLAQLDGLVEHARGAGLEVEVRLQGEAVALPAGVDLSAYRIVQEALTNTVKHAGARHAEVVVRYGRGELTVQVLDDGPRLPDSPPALNGAGGGHGLAGMRERAALYGGELHAGRRPDGPGFAVRARLPLYDTAR